MKVELNSNDELITWDYAKRNLQLCLQPKTNEDIVKRDFLDLEQYVRISVSHDKTLTYIVTPKILENFNISEEELFNTAMSLLKENIKIINLLQMGDEKSKDNMIVITSNTQIFGASSICCIDKMKYIAEQYHSSFIVLPSSIHECIIKFLSKEELDYCNNIVNEVNNAEVDVKERLSNHAYFFNKDTCTFEF